MLDRLVEYYRCPAGLVRGGQRPRLSAADGYFAFVVPSVMGGQPAHGQRRRPTAVFQMFLMRRSSRTATSTCRSTCHRSSITCATSSHYQNGRTFAFKLTPSEPSERIYYFVRPVLPVSVPATNTSQGAGIKFRDIVVGSGVSNTRVPPLARRCECRASDESGYGVAARQSARPADAIHLVLAGWRLGCSDRHARRRITGRAGVLRSANGDRRLVWNSFIVSDNSRAARSVLQPLVRAAPRPRV
jgi:hypothetical protein